MFTYQRPSFWLLLWFCFAFVPLFTYAAATKSPLYIAHLAPMSDSATSLGQDVVDAIQMYLDDINEQGGVNGHPVKLRLLDESGLLAQVKQQVEDEIDTNQSLAILGHHYSSIAEQLGILYKQKKIPGIIYLDSSETLIQDNPWFFMISSSARQMGTVGAQYVSRVLKRETAAMVLIEDAFSRSLEENFLRLFDELDGIVLQQHILPEEKNSIVTINSVVEQITSSADFDENTVILSSLYENDSAELITALRRRGIDNTVIVLQLSEDLIKIINQMPEEKYAPGQLSENVYILLGLLLDSSGVDAQEFRKHYKRRFQKEPDWAAAFAYDTAKVVVEGLKAINAKGKDIVKERLQLANYLAQLNSPANAIQGISGLIYFDENGGIIKPPFLGLIKDQHFISALTQFTPIHNCKQIVDFEEQLEKGWIVENDGQYMHKISVVYTSVEMHSITQVNEESKTAFLDFYLWFRYQDGIDATNIVFTNAAEPIALPEPLEELRQDGRVYRLYRVQGHFYMDFMARYRDHYALGEHLLGLRFRHQDRTANKLLYVKDSIGGEEALRQANLDILKNLPGFSNSWKVNDVLTFQDRTSDSIQGNPHYFEYGERAEFSRFNFAIDISGNSFTLRRLMPVETAQWVALISLIALIALTILRLVRYRKFPNSRGAKLSWLLKIPFYILFILALEPIALVYFSHENHLQTIEFIRVGCDMLWWLLPAYFLSHGIENLLWIPLEQRGGYEIPPLMRGLVVFTIYSAAILGIMALVLNMHITSILATSGIMALVIGLALKMNISNLFSGIAINVDRPFRLGNWIKVGNYPIGKVIGITWRATRIQTAEGNILSIPNAVAADSTVYNFHYPNDKCRECLTLHIDFKYSPETIKPLLLDAANSVKGLASESPPSVHFRFGTWSADYLVCFHIYNYANREQYRTQVNEQLHAHLRNANIPLAKPHSALTI